MQPNIKLVLIVRSRQIRDRSVKVWEFFLLNIIIRKLWIFEGACDVSCELPSHFPCSKNTFPLRKMSIIHSPQKELMETCSYITPVWNQMRGYNSLWSVNNTLLEILNLLICNNVYVDLYIVRKTYFGQFYTF